MALCLETASLQRWKCETLIDHFNWKPFVLRATERERERGLRANVRGTKKNPVSTLRTATYGLTLNKTKKKKKHIHNTNTRSVHFPRWWRLRSLSSPDQRQQINRKLWGDFFFFRINVGLIIIRDPITAFVP